MGAALEFAERTFGGNLTEREDTVAVGVAQVNAVVGDPDRVGLVITNIGTTNITLSYNSPVTLGQGMLLLGNGSVFDSRVAFDGSVVALPIFAIGNVAGGSIRVVEIIRGR